MLPVGVAKSHDYTPEESHLYPGSWDAMVIEVGWQLPGDNLGEDVREGLDKVLVFARIVLKSAWHVRDVKLDPE